jgi:hypothetical protein
VRPWRARAVESLYDSRMTHVLGDFAAITSHVQGRVVALGNIYREETAKEKLKGGFLSSLLGSFAKTAITPDRWKYIALTDQHTVHILDFANGNLVERDDLVLANVRAAKVHSDESWLVLELEHAGKNFRMKIHRYQLPDLENNLLGDVEQMKQVGEMTKTLEAAFRSRM